jgi:hypothetical protein
LPTSVITEFGEIPNVPKTVLSLHLGFDFDIGAGIPRLLPWKNFCSVFCPITLFNAAECTP